MIGKSALARALCEDVLHIICNSPWNSPFHTSLFSQPYFRRRQISSPKSNGCLTEPNIPFQLFSTANQIASKLITDRTQGNIHHFAGYTYGSNTQTTQELHLIYDLQQQQYFPTNQTCDRKHDIVESRSNKRFG